MLDQNNKIDNTNFNSNVSTDVSKELREVPKYLSNIFKHLKFLILIEIVLVLVIGYIFLIRNKVSSIKEINSLIIEKQNEVNNLLNYKSKSEELSKKYEELKKSKDNDIEKIKEVLPSESDLPGIMAQVEALVKENGLELGSISLSALEENELPKEDTKKNVVKGISKKNVDSDMSGIKEVNVAIFVFGSNGGYDKIKSFLSALENHIRLIDIVSFNFDEKMSSYSINFKTYYLSNEK
ncbi:MAG: hypothetical protein PHZ07_00540 [Patescibacteria group bacterium]|nr:hypothetical protein [Patescibacteria group bacterium]MDD4304210.1 hypothetical protein [Patescibacteria group bacterium]MDD4695243.1 hypothetical protein [Patescibacteria group bacterium]